MGLNLDPQAERARDLAKRAVPEGGVLDIDLLLSALYHAGELQKRLPDLAAYLPEPPKRREKTPESVPLSLPLRTVLTDLAQRSQAPLDPQQWFRELLLSEPGKAYLRGRGMEDSVLQKTLDLLREGETTATNREEAGSWRRSEERRAALEALGSYGRVLTDGNVSTGVFVEQEEAVRSLVRVLIKRKQRNALVVGPPGTGKSALVQELARRLVGRDPTVPARLLDCDIFELSPSFLRSGASMVGEYDRRVKQVLEVLRENPRILLFVDEVHSLLQSGMHERGPFTDANESFKQALSKGEICLIGCTTTAEYRHYIAADAALAQRFSLVSMEPPSLEATRGILLARLPKLEKYYQLRVPPELVDKALELTENHLPSRAQPRKSIQVLDEACAFAVADPAGTGTLREADLWSALEETVGRSVIHRGELTADGLYEELSNGIEGQDRVLEELARSVVAGLGSMAAHRKGPRGVYVLGGPSGVGKTETAVRLSRVLGGGREALIRINCNMLHGSAHDRGPAQNILLGVPPGFLGYVRGNGGELSRIRDHPQSVVLFDEIEKASSTISDLLLQIIDDGQCEDAEGNLLDFRRSFILFTTNVGSTRTAPPIGFGGPDAASGPSTDEASLRSALRAMGFHDAFLGRMDAFFVFAPLDRPAVLRILEAALRGLGSALRETGRSLETGPDVAGVLADRWQPEFGARHLTALVDRITREISVGEAAGELEGVSTVRITATRPDTTPVPELRLERRLENRILIIHAR